MTRRALPILVLALGLLPSSVSAQGFEFASAGTRALGRGGAFAARADDPMALAFNPANLAELTGYQLMLGSHLTFYDACAQRTGTYGDSNPTGFNESVFGPVEGYASTPFPEVCRGGPPSPSPQLVFTGRPAKWIGFGLGVLAPAGVASSTWGQDGQVVGPDGNMLPSPVRYGVAESDLFLMNITAGVGIRPVHWFRFGLSLQWGIGIVRFVNYTNSAVGPEDPGDDVRTQLDAVDPFVPALIASLHFVPIDELDIVLTGRISDGLNASGTLGVTTGAFGTGSADSLVPTLTEIQDARLRAGQPWQFGLSVRYADRIRPRPDDSDQAERVTGRVEDAMQNENWDIELSLIYTMNSQVRDFVIDLPVGAEAQLCDGPSDSPNCLASPLPSSLPIPQGWHDQVGIHLGGDGNIIPGVFAVRGGMHFQTSGLSRYQTPAILPGMRLGFHLGATLRVERFDISIAYAHIFQFEESINDANHRNIAVRGNEGRCAAPDPYAGGYADGAPVTETGCYPAGHGAIINGGSFGASFNVVSLQASYHF